jgi:hypothetical protein
MKIVRVVRLSLVFALFLAPSAFAAQAPFAITISAPTEIWSGEAAIRVEVKVTNISDHEIRIYKALGPGGQAEAANDVEVAGPDGKALPRIDGRAVTVHGEVHHFAKQWISRKTVPLGPAQSLDDFLILSDLFDLSSPGIYTVKLQHGVRSDDPVAGPGLVYGVSNTITITVTP